MAWFKKSRRHIARSQASASRIPEGLWVKCPSCAQAIFSKELAGSLQVCTKCGHHFRMGAAERLVMLLDGEPVEFDAGLRSTDPLGFKGLKVYRDQLDASIKATGLNDAVICATGTLEGLP